MPRRRKKFSIIARAANRFWYYKHADEDRYHPTEIEIRRNRNGDATNRDEAESWVHIHGARQVMLSERPNYAALLADAWLRNRDPRIVAKFLDWNGEGAPPISERTIREARRRLEMYVIGDTGHDEDAVCHASLDEGVRPWLQWKARRKEQGVPARTINQTLKETATYLSYRVALGDIPFHPLAAVPKMQEEKSQTGIYTESEIKAMVAHPEWWGYSRPATDDTPAVRREKEDEKWMPQAHGLAVVLLSTLTRPSELLQVQWQHVDAEGQVLRLPMQKKVRGRGADGRVIPLTHHAIQAFNCIRGASTHTAPTDYVWSAADGGRRTNTFFRKRWQHMMSVSGMLAVDPDGRNRVPYSLKHAMITAALNAGVNPRDVALMAAHSVRNLGEFSLTAAQAHYAARVVEKLRERVVPVIESIMESRSDNVIDFRRSADA